MNIFEHNGAYNASSPVLIFTKKSTGITNQKRIEGVAKNGGGDIATG